MEIAVLLTCHNRRVKTKNCLQSLKEALAVYANEAKEKVCIEIFLTDDGCTDGTAEVARGVFADDKVLHILQGDGNLFWAGGMRFCWREAMKRHTEWDYYLLLNDDTELMPNVFAELFGAERFAMEHYGKEGIVSGITCAKDDPTKLTYGGDVWVNRFLSTKRRLEPNGEPQLCDFTNANIMLVPMSVVDRIGIFYDGFQHGKADNDYANTARKYSIPVVLTANFCGRCDNDHVDGDSLAHKISSMSLKERKAYYKNPIHSSCDYFRFVKRTQPLRLPLVWFGGLLNLYWPKLYYKISGLRK